MIVQCDNCHTKYNLDESALTPEGSWVRCTNCGNVFQVLPEGAAKEEPPAAEAAPAQEQETDLGLDDDLLGVGLGDESGADAAIPEDGGLDLEAELGGEEPKGGGKLFKIIFWLLAICLILVVLAAGGLVALDRLGMAPSLVDRARTLPGVPYLLKLVGSPGKSAARPQESAPTQNLALEDVRGYFRINKKLGRIFVIQGMVVNRGGDPRTKILVQGRLRDARGNVVRQAVVYAGPIFSPEELRSLTLAEIQARLAKPTAPDGSAYVLSPSDSLPFMVVFANVPTNVSEFTAEVVNAKPMGGGTQGGG